MKKRIIFLTLGLSLVSLVACNPVEQKHSTNEVHQQKEYYSNEDIAYLVARYEDLQYDLKTKESKLNVKKVKDGYRVSPYKQGEAMPNGGAYYFVDRKATYIVAYDGNDKHIEDHSLSKEKDILHAFTVIKKEDEHLNIHTLQYEKETEQEYLFKQCDKKIEFVRWYGYDKKTKIVSIKEEADIRQ